jgi:hypothetical protein
MADIDILIGSDDVDEELRLRTIKNLFSVAPYNPLERSLETHELEEICQVAASLGLSHAVNRELGPIQSNISTRGKFGRLGRQKRGSQSPATGLAEVPWGDR